MVVLLNDIQLIDALVGGIGASVAALSKKRAAALGMNNYVLAGVIWSLVFVLRKLGQNVVKGLSPDDFEIEVSNKWVGLAMLGIALVLCGLFIGLTDAHKYVMLRSMSAFPWFETAILAAIVCAVYVVGAIQNRS